MSLSVIYRLSTNSYKKERFEFATKEYCLINFLKHFPRNIVHLMIDDTNLNLETLGVLSAMHREQEFASFTMHTGGSSAGAWRNAVTKMQSLNLADSDYVYHIEDDYLHRENSMKVLLEGLARADYTTLYLHGDRFIPSSKGGNPYIDDAGSFSTKVLKTETSFWCQIESTTMTVAASIGTFKDDMPIWEKWTLSTYPQDFQAFLELTKKGKCLICPIPGYSTHTEPKWKSPLIDWSKV